MKIEVPEIYDVRDYCAGFWAAEVRHAATIAVDEVEIVRTFDDGTTSSPTVWSRGEFVYWASGERRKHGGRPLGEAAERA